MRSKLILSGRLLSPIRKDLYERYTSHVHPIQSGRPVLGTCHLPTAIDSDRNRSRSTSGRKLAVDFRLFDRGCVIAHKARSRQQNGLALHFQILLVCLSPRRLLLYASVSHNLRKMFLCFILPKSGGYPQARRGLICPTEAMMYHRSNIRNTKVNCQMAQSQLFFVNNGWRALHRRRQQ